MTSLNADQQPVTTTSYLFTVRLWIEEVGGERYEVRMQVRYALTGEVRYFREWASAINYMQSIPDAEGSHER